MELNSATSTRVSPEIIQELSQNTWIVEHPDRVVISARDAFQTAQTLLLNKPLQACETNAPVPSTVEELLAAINQARLNYDSRKSGKASKWIARLSSRVTFYGQVMDVLSQHHPEYVSLAWGLLKLVFIGIINQETLIKELSKALCRICEAVRHVQLKLLLYPVKEMQELVGRLYANLIKFAVRAIKWYREPRILHALSAIARPYPLRFKDIVEDIHDTIRQIDRLALSMSQAEQRQILLKLDETRAASQDVQRMVRLELEATRKELEASRLMLAELNMAISRTNQFHFSGLINTNRQLSEIQFSQIMTFLSTSALPSPEAVHNALSAKRKLRLRQGSNQIFRQNLYNCPVLQTWGANPDSSQILIDGHFTNRHQLRDFATEVIDLVSSANIPVVWMLLIQAFWPEEIAPGDVLKYLASQILKYNHTSMDERSASLSARRFQSARTEGDWFDLLGTVLEGLQQVYLVIDLGLVERLARQEQGKKSWLAEFPKLFDRLRERGVQTVVKVAFVRATNIKEGGEEVQEETLETTGYIRILKRDSGRVWKAGGKRGKKRKGGLARALGFGERVD